MIYDNEYALKNARGLIENHKYSGEDEESLIKKISAELIRFYTLGVYSVVDPMEKQLKIAKAKLP